VLAFGNDWSQASHVSLLADAGDYAVVSLYGTDAPGLYHGEVLAVSTDGAHVWHVAHHRSAVGDVFIATLEP
jgi:hypothetical protein